MIIDLHTLNGAVVYLNSDFILKFEHNNSGIGSYIYLSNGDTLTVDIDPMVLQDKINKK